MNTAKRTRSPVPLTDLAPRPRSLVGRQLTPAELGAVVGGLPPVREEGTHTFDDDVDGDGTCTFDSDWD